MGRPISVFGGFGAVEAKLIQIIMLKGSIILACLLHAVLSQGSGSGFGYECCPIKEIYGHWDPNINGIYYNIGVLPPNKPRPHGCFDSCMYTKEGGTGAKFCMGYSEDTLTECINTGFSGYSGNSGYSGYSGYSGFSGSSGYSGYIDGYGSGSGGYGSGSGSVTLAIFTLHI